MTKQHRYELYLWTAKHYELNGKIDAAVWCLGKAEKHTEDRQELKHLELWEQRLRERLATEKERKKP
jgi:hypothetical protein